MTTTCKICGGEQMYDNMMGKMCIFCMWTELNRLKKQVLKLERQHRRLLAKLNRKA